ncbi:MAG: hypothetical protein HYY30_03110 [Chloroflexi bacterium]|nr:hypothetical protein [Chloroflexota bacterium]
MRGFLLVSTVVSVLLGPLLVPSAISPAVAADCRFVLGFETIHDLIPAVVGDCLVDERYEPENGDALQETTNGLLVWRKADNFTAFTDGHRTWINGPYGIQQRLNTEHFPSEFTGESVNTGSTNQPTAPVEEWLSRLNFYRAIAKLPPLMEDPSLSKDAQTHARYMVKNDAIGHTEDPANEWYTPEGLAAAQSSLLLALSFETSDGLAIDGMMQSVFHAVSVLNPGLQGVGYGRYREEKPGIRMGAALDTLRGERQRPSAGSFPVLWPGDGTFVPLNGSTNEIPNILTGCPGYSAPTGLPVLLQVGPGNDIPVVSSHSFLGDSIPLEHCVFDETSYTNPNPDQETTGRSILEGNHTVVLIPRAPLIPGTVYTVSITVSGETFAWSFTASARTER